MFECSADLSAFFTHNSNSPGDLMYLRTLVCIAEYHTNDAILTLPDLPNAETVTIQCPYLPLKWDGLHLPSVRRLHCGTTNQTDILGLLDACPSLESLTLDLERFSNRPLDDAKSALIRDKISRLQEMVVLNSDHLTDGIVASMFHVPAVPTLVLPSCSKPAFAIFQDVRDDVHLHIAHTGSEFDPTVTVTATDSGMTRSLSVYWFYGPGSGGTSGPRYIRLQLHGHLSHSSITSLTLPSDIWPHLLSDISVFSCVRRATVTFNTDIAILDTLTDHQAPLPALEILQLDAHPPLLSVSMKDVAAYITSLKGAGTRLNRLILRGVVLDGDVEELANVGEIGW